VLPVEWRRHARTTPAFPSSARPRFAHTRTLVRGCLSGAVGPSTPRRRQFPGPMSSTSWASVGSALRGAGFVAGGVGGTHLDVADVDGQVGPEEVLSVPSHRCLATSPPDDHRASRGPEVVDPLAEVETTCPPKPTATNATAKINTARTERDRVAPLGRILHPCPPDIAASLADRAARRQPPTPAERGPCEGYGTFLLGEHDRLITRWVWARSLPRGSAHTRRRRAILRRGSDSPEGLLRA
jgi:hypothetical protein